MNLHRMEIFNIRSCIKRHVWQRSPSASHALSYYQTRILHHSARHGLLHQTALSYRRCHYATQSRNSLAKTPITQQSCSPRCSSCSTAQSQIHQSYGSSLETMSSLSYKRRLPSLGSGCSSAVDRRQLNSLASLEHSRLTGRVAAQGSGQPGLLTGLFQAIQAGLQQASEEEAPNPASVVVDRLFYHPPGAETALLQDISFHLPAMKMGLVYGRSGAGKTTLLQILAGLATPSAGVVSVTPQQTTASPNMTASQLASVVGLVFQFPERHFLGTTILDELTFGWPSDPWQREAAKIGLVKVLEAVDLDHIPITTNLRDLSDGYKRRVALAVQLARSPSLLLLDEPLAGLDWKSRADVARVLGKTRTKCTILAVSHDLRELVPLVDHAWRMEPGGLLKSSEWPPIQ